MDSLDLRIIGTATRCPTSLAVEDCDGHELTYASLASNSERFALHLISAGVQSGDRVGIIARKSASIIPLLLGILRIGAAYVPCDATAPAIRNAYILADCNVAVVVTGEQEHYNIARELNAHSSSPPILPLKSLSSATDYDDEKIMLQELDCRRKTISGSTLACILYTSGSSGQPKGVQLTHGNLLSFLDWCTETFAPSSDDRFSSHAPIHFDLSILDIFLPLMHGAAVVLIDPILGKEPRWLSAFISEKRITSWYSTPTVLRLITSVGLLAGSDTSMLKRVLFAGEVFPIRAFEELRNQLNHPRFFNLYGPTETNVCTYFEIGRDQSHPLMTDIPIGKPCSHVATQVLTQDGRAAEPGQCGELWIHGPGVSPGYWKLPSESCRVFTTDETGRQWYRTGDIVRESPAGLLYFLGRVDRMIKKRGYRVELLEIESVLHRHPQIGSCAVVVNEVAGDIKVIGYVCARENQILSPIELKMHCSSRLPLYMIPDEFVFVDQLPVNANGKVDYRSVLSSYPSRDQF